MERCPGAKGRLSNAHLGEKHFSPLRESLSPRRRHSLQTGPLERAISLLNSPPLARSATVVRYRCHVADAGDLNAGGLERADRRFASAARALDAHVHLPETMVDGPTGGRLGGQAGGVGRALAGALEAGGAGAGPGEHVAVGVRERDGGVVEAGLDEGQPNRHVLLLPLSGACLGLSFGHVTLSPTSWRWRAACRRRCGGRRAWCGRWSAFAGPAPAVRGGGVSHGSC